MEFVLMSDNLLNGSVSDARAKRKDKDRSVQNADDKYLTEIGKNL